MRNLLLIHLESLNNTNYRTNQELFPALRRWEQKSLSFSRYFSTATSTLMVLSDLAYGGMFHCEPCDGLADDLWKHCYQDSFLDRIQEEGYRVKVVGYPENKGGDAAECNKRDFIGYHVKMDEIENYEAYLEYLDRAMTREKPFAVWACNCMSNVSYNIYVDSIREQNGLERWESGYRYMDRCAADLLDILERKDLLEQTTILFYGDHGDDLFAHGRHRGLTHAIEPYESLIHTPFWIYDSRFSSERISALIDTTDISGLAERLLHLPERKLGIGSLGLPERKYSLARNVYAAQKVREMSFHKAYSLTDGRFLFLAGNQGMELYHIGMDAACQHNLLDYFDFDRGSLILKQASYERVKFHFPYVIDEKAIRQIQELFYEYRRQTMTEVRRLYEYAECGNLSLEVDFENIHYGWEERERRGAAEITDGRQETFELYARYLTGKRIVLYGAGNYGRYFYEKMAERTVIAAWVDRGCEQIGRVLDREIQPPACVADTAFDMVFIAVANGRVRNEIKNMLMQMGIPREKIC